MAYLLDKFRFKMRGDKIACLIQVNSRGEIFYPFYYNEQRKELRAEGEFADRVSGAEAGKLFAKLSPELALGWHEPFVFERDPKKPVSEAELDHLFSQMLFKFGNMGKAALAERLGIPGSEIVLLNVVVWETLVDGGAVLDPVDCLGGRLEFRLGGVFALQDVMPRLVRFGADFAEVTAADVPLAYGFSEIRPPGKSVEMIVSAGVETAVITELGPGRIFPRDFFKWKEANSSVDNKIADAHGTVYNKNKKASPGDIDCHILLRGIEAAAKTFNARVAHLFVLEDSADYFRGKKVGNREGAEMRIEPAPIFMFRDEFGFTLKFGERGNMVQALKLLPELIYRLRLPKSNRMSVLAEKHRRWMERVK